MYKLRELELRDLDAINAWRNDPQLISQLGAPFRYIGSYVDRQWFERYTADRASTVRCAIVRESTDKIIGLISLLNIDHLNQSAELHIMIGDKGSQNQGAGSFAVNAIVRHAFDDLNLHRVELEALEENTRARHVYEKAGFALEGSRRDAVYKNGEFKNVMLYAIIRPDAEPG